MYRDGGDIHVHTIESNIGARQDTMFSAPTMAQLADGMDKLRIMEYIVGLGPGHCTDKKRPLFTCLRFGRPTATKWMVSASESTKNACDLELRRPGEGK